MFIQVFRAHDEMDNLIMCDQEFIFIQVFGTHDAMDNLIICDQ